MIQAAAIRRKVEGILGRSVPEGYWRWAVERDYLTDYELTGDISVLVDLFRGLLEADEQNRAEARKKAEETRTVPPDERLRYLADILAVEAARLPEVVRFRETYLGGRLLPFEEVEDWIKRTQAADGPGSVWYTIALRRDHVVKDDGVFPRLRDLLATLAQLPEEELNRFISGAKVETIDYIVPTSQHVRRVPIQHDGTLYRLKLVARLLEGHYGWSEAHGVVFTLTGLTPPIPKARVTTPGIVMGPHGRIKLELDPRLSSDEVRDIYAQARSQVFKGRDRPMSKRHLELALFLVKNPYHTWREMCELWNRQYPQWAYSIWQNFSRDARAAYRRLTGRNWVHQGKREEERSGE